MTSFASNLPRTLHQTTPSSVYHHHLHQNNQPSFPLIQIKDIKDNSKTCNKFKFKTIKQVSKLIIYTHQIFVVMLMQIKGDKIQSENEKLTFLILCFIHAHDWTCVMVKISSASIFA